jgi:HD-like signal output (HDOD) protein
MMFVASAALLIAALLIAALAIGLLTRRPPPTTRAALPHQFETAAPLQPLTQLKPFDAPERLRPVPPELIGFRVIGAHELDAASRLAMLTTFEDVPRPPKLLHQLLSPDFLDRASSAELADLIAAEPLIAARVLSTVNSTHYALKQPVQSIEKGVNHLGLNTVRSICMRYLLIATLRADGPERQQVLDRTWRASGLASELVHAVACRLDLPDRGALVSAVVLSFLGRLATAATVPREVLAQIPESGYLDRCKAEQRLLGLTAPEVGRLLMQHWALPPTIIDDASATGCVRPSHGPKVGPESGPGQDPVRTNRQALCYLCARVSERLVDGRLPSLQALDFDAEGDVDFHRLQSGLNETLLAKAGAALRSPDLQALAARMLQVARPVSP